MHYLLLYNLQIFECIVPLALNKQDKQVSHNRDNFCCIECILQQHNITNRFKVVPNWAVTLVKQVGTDSVK